MFARSRGLRFWKDMVDIFLFKYVQMCPILPGCLLSKPRLDCPNYQQCIRANSIPRTTYRNEPSCRRLFRRQLVPQKLQFLYWTDRQRSRDQLAWHRMSTSMGCTTRCWRAMDKALGPRKSNNLRRISLGLRWSSTARLVFEWFWLESTGSWLDAAIDQRILSPSKFSFKKG